jgi:hypothetical protein
VVQERLVELRFPAPETLLPFQMKLVRLTDRWPPSLRQVAIRRSSEDVLTNYFMSKAHRTDVERHVAPPFQASLSAPTTAAPTASSKSATSAGRHARWVVKPAIDTPASGE